MNRKEAMRQAHQEQTLRSLGFTADEAQALRRISMTLHRWHELECGTDEEWGKGNHVSVSVERDDEHEATCTQCGHKWWGESALDHSCPQCGDIAPLRRKASGKVYKRVQYATRDGYVDRREPTADRETGAKKRLAAIIGQRNGRPAIVDGRLNAAPTGKVSAYIQTDPRGAALYILRPGDVPEGSSVESCYSRGICVY